MFLTIARLLKQSSTLYICHFDIYSLYSKTVWRTHCIHCFCFCTFFSSLTPHCNWTAN
jgi:hypothetical protein